MSKIVAGAAFVLLGGATVAGGVLLHKGSKSNQNTNEEKTATNYDSELPSTFSEMQSKVHEEGCIKGLFSGLSSVPTSADSATGTNNNIGEDFFKDASKTTGCLVVNWDKDSYTTPSNNWKGNIRFLWAAEGGNKGFIFLLAGTSSNDGSKKEIKWEAASYTLEKSTGENASWTAKKNHEVTSGTKSFEKGTSTPEEKHFPRPHTNLGLETNQTFWGLFDNVSALDNLCTTSGCTDPSTKSSFRGYWEWESGTGTHKLSEWTQEMCDWWKAIFDDTKFKAKTLADKQTGTWTNRVNNTTPPQTPSAA